MPRKKQSRGAGARAAALTARRREAGELYTRVQDYLDMSARDIAKAAKIPENTAMYLRRIRHQASAATRAALAAGEITVAEAIRDVQNPKITRAPVTRKPGSLKGRGAGVRTPNKLAVLGPFLKELVHTFGTQPFVYVDLNAGPGTYAKDEVPGGGDGSPIQLVRSLTEADKADVFLVERDPEVMKRLWKAMSEQPPVGVRRLQYMLEDNETFAGTFRALYMSQYRGAKGLVFADPMGAGKSEWTALDDLAVLTHMDLLLHFQWNQHQRAHSHDASHRTLLERIQRTNREFNLVTEPKGQNGFGFFFATDNAAHAAVATKMLGAVPYTQAAWLR